MESPLYASPLSPPPPHTATAEMSDKLASLHREMTTLRLECDRLIHKHEMVKASLVNSGTVALDTSSAYNTGGESCRSDSLTPEGLNCIECQSCLVICPPSPSSIRRSSVRGAGPPEPPPSASIPFRMASPLRTTRNQYYHQEAEPVYSPPSVGMVYAPPEQMHYRADPMQWSLRVPPSSSPTTRRSMQFGGGTPAAQPGTSCPPSPLLRRSVVIPPSPYDEPGVAHQRQYAVPEVTDYYQAPTRPPPSSSPMPLHRSRVLPPLPPTRPPSRVPQPPPPPLPPRRDDTPRPSPAPADPVASTEAEILKESLLQEEERGGQGKRTSFVLSTSLPRSVKSNAIRKFTSRISNGVRETLYMFERPVDDFFASEARLYGGSESGEGEEGAGASTIVPPTLIASFSQKTADVQYKWKVLKKREAQLLRERPTGLSTDDDAFSGIKLGHFVSPTERKRILDKEKARKRRYAQKVMEAAKATTEQPILSLSQRKQHRRQGDLLMDDFATTKEWLSQRNPVSSSSRGPQIPQPKGIPTVTTV